MMILSLIKDAWTDARRTAANRSAARQVHTMSDHQLADIGIARDQIDAIVNGASPVPARQADAQPFRRPAFALTGTRTA